MVQNIYSLVGWNVVYISINFNYCSNIERKVMKESRDKVNNKRIFKNVLPSKHQSNKIVKRIQTIRRQFTGELSECVWPFWGIGA